MVMTKAELKERCDEMAVNDLTGYNTAEDYFNDYRMDNDYAKTLDDYDDDDEFYVDGDRIISCDETADLYVHELAVDYVLQNGLEKEYEEYLICYISIYSSEIQYIDTAAILKAYVMEDDEDYIDWLWCKK